MTTRMLTAMLVLCGGVLLGAQSDDLFVNDPRPVAQMASKIAQQTNWTITYEDPSYQYAADIEESDGTDAFGKRVSVMRHVPFVFTLDRAKRQDAVKTVQELVDTFEMRTGGQKFKVIAEKGWIHLVPQLNRDKNGAWAEQRPVLDTRISLPAGKRHLVDFLNEFSEAVLEGSGRRIVMGTMSLNLIFNTEVELPAFKNTQARDVLREALSQAPVKLTWYLLGGVGDDNQALNVSVVGTRRGPPE